MVVVRNRRLGHTLRRRVRLWIRVLGRTIHRQCLCADGNLVYNMYFCSVRSLGAIDFTRGQAPSPEERYATARGGNCGAHARRWFSNLLCRLSNQHGLDSREILSGKGPPTISGKLTDQSYTAVAWVCYQSIAILGADGSTKNYSLFFHPRVPIGRNCRFRILPRCKTILSIEAEKLR